MCHLQHLYFGGIAARKNIFVHHSMKETEYLKRSKTTRIWWKYIFCISKTLVVTLYEYRELQWAFASNWVSNLPGLLFINGQAVVWPLQLIAFSSNGIKQERSATEMEFPQKCSNMLLKPIKDQARVHHEPNLGKRANFLACVQNCPWC